MIRVHYDTMNTKGIETGVERFIRETILLESNGLYYVVRQTRVLELICQTLRLFLNTSKPHRRYPLPVQIPVMVLKLNSTPGD